MRWPTSARGFGLKWPNDVLADGRKLAGILVEIGGEFLGPCHAVIGIGINVELPAIARTAIDQPATDLRALCAQPPSRNRLAGELLRHLVATLDRFERDGFAPFRARFEQLDLLRDVPLQLSDARGRYRGVGAGVDDRGALRLRHVDDAVVAYDSADVTVRRA